MDEIAVITDPEAAEASLNPIRSLLLAELADPDSASGLAAKLGLARQRGTTTCGRSSSTDWWSWSRSAESAT